MYEIRVVLSEVESIGKRKRKSVVLRDERVALYDISTAAVFKYIEVVEAAERICS